MKPDHVRVWPTAKAPPASLSTGMVCEAVGCTVAALLDAAERGVVPVPDCYNGQLLWSPEAVAQMKDGRPTIPGMQPPMPPGYDRNREIRSWKKNVARGSIRFLRCDPKTRRPLPGQKEGA